MNNLHQKYLSTCLLATAALLYGPAQGLAAVPILGPDLATFAVLGAADGVTNVPTSTIFGNLGSAPSASVDGGYSFTAGSLQANTLLAQNAQVQLDAAILAVNAGVGTSITNGDLDAWQSGHSNVISPGTYDVPFNTTNLAGNLVLDGGGSNTALWKFRFASSLITSTTSNVTVQGVGDGAGVGVFWTTGSFATLNGPTFAGNVLAHDLISSDGDLTIDCGRLLSAETKVTLIHDKISIGCAGTSVDTAFKTSGGFAEGVDIGSGGIIGAPIPEPEVYVMLAAGLGLMGFVARRKKLKEGATA